jgi:hypothetical protein
MFKAIRPSRSALVSVAAAAMVLAPLPLAVGTSAQAAPAAHKPRVAQYRISTHVRTVKSSTHKSLSYSLDFSGHPGSAVGSDPDILNVVLASGTTESHDWLIPFTHKVIHINAAKGTGTIDTTDQMKGFGRVDVTVSPAGKARTICPDAGGSETVRQVVLAGRPRFDSRSGKWGVVGAHKRRLKATLRTDFGDGGCGSVTTPCPSVGTLLQASGSTGSVAAETIRGTRAILSGGRNVQLKAVDGDRTDTISATGVLAMKKHGHGISVALKAVHKRVKGTATLVAKHAPQTQACDQVSTASYQATHGWKNGSEPLTFHGQIGGRFTLNKHVFADVEVTTPAANTPGLVTDRH